MRISDWSSDVCSSDLGVLGDEVGLGVDLDQHGLAGFPGHRDAALGGDAAGLLVGLGQARLAQQLGGGIDVAAGLGQRLLAFHPAGAGRSEEHTSELQSLMRISYAVFCLKTKT